MTTIGFHTGVGGNNNGIDTYIKDNVTPFIKSTDDYGILQHALNLNPNSLCIFRQPVYDVPNYNVSPKESAIQHYNFIRAKLPPEFDKNRVWLEVVNEVDKDRAEWLAEFCLEFNILAHDYRLVFFNWSTGEPEQGHWQGHKMSQLLRLCEQNKHRLAIGLHEYSLDVDAINKDFPYLVGRVKFLRQIYSGRIFITEFGWTHNNMKPELALNHLTKPMQLEENYNDSIYNFYLAQKVDGFALWCLNRGWDNLDAKLNSVLLPISNWLKNNYKPISNTPPPNNKIKHTIHLLPQDTTLAELKAVTEYLHPNRTAFTYSADAAKDLVLAGTPESKVVCWDAERWNGNLVEWFNVRGVYNVQLREFSEIMNTPPNPLPPPNSYGYRGRPVTFQPAIHSPGSDWMLNEPETRAYLHLTTLPMKFMSNGVSSNYFNEFRDSRFELIRIYYQFGSQYKNPQALFDELKGDIERFYLLGARQFELFNEPNLPQEGLGTFWNNGKEFGQYIKQFGQLCKQKFPQIKLYYPGLSPGVPFTNQLPFTQAALVECQSILDGFCLHAYTGILTDKYAAKNDIVNQVMSVQSYLKLQIPMIISECSVNRGNVDYQYKAQVYRLVENALMNKPGIEGIVYFISKWLPPPEQTNHGENWIGTNILEYYK